MIIVEKYRKAYVAVDVLFDVNGKMIPRSITWEDGRVYDIDRITDVRRAASLKAGGQGIRYTCRIRGKEKYLFYDTDKWFVEASLK